MTLNFDLSFSHLRINPIENPDRITHFHHVVLTMSLLMQGIADIELVQKFFFPFRRQRRLCDVVGGFGLFSGSPAGDPKRKFIGLCDLAGMYGYAAFKYR